MFNGEAFGTAIVKQVADLVSPLKARIAELEKQLAERVPAAFHIDRDGALVQTMQNGVVKNLGVVTTKGEPGRDGTDGKDGFDLTGFDVRLEDDGRTIVMDLENETQKASASITLAVPLYKGLWTDGEAYERGDTVTHNGSLWIAEADVSDRPGAADGWKLAVKRGRDGR